MKDQKVIHFPILLINKRKIVNFTPHNTATYRVDRVKKMKPEM